MFDSSFFIFWKNATTDVLFNRVNCNLLYETETVNNL